MTTLEGFKIIKIEGNSHIGEEIEHAIFTDHLWVRAVPTVEVAGFKTTPHPTHLVFMDASGADAEAAFDNHCQEQGS